MKDLHFKKFCYAKMAEIRSNPFYAEILQNLYMGDKGEVISYLQFCYQSFILLPFGSELGNVFEKIANEDFLHMKLLSERIISFGGNPVFSNSQGILLGGRSINYCKDKRSMILTGIEFKENSLINYKTAFGKVEDINLKNVFKSIIIDEEVHLTKLKECLNKINIK